MREDLKRLLIRGAPSSALLFRVTPKHTAITGPYELRRAIRYLSTSKTQCPYEYVLLVRTESPFFLSFTSRSMFPSSASAAIEAKRLQRSSIRIYVLSLCCMCYSKSRWSKPSYQYVCCGQICHEYLTLSIRPLWPKLSWHHKAIWHYRYAFRGQSYLALQSNLTSNRSWDSPQNRSSAVGNYLERFFAGTRHLQTSFPLKGTLVLTKVPWNLKGTLVLKRYPGT